MSSRERADEVVRALQAAGLLDPARKIRDEGDVVIPVLPRADLPEWAARLGARLVERALPARTQRVPPREAVVARLLARLPGALAEQVPDKWEQHGDVLVVRLPDVLRPHAEAVGAAFAEVLGLKCVLDDPGGVEGELREMQARVVWGQDPVATHVEDGIRYTFDASRIMFSSGNVAERMRAGRIPARGETVVDMFAGIGYFTLPLALRAGAARVHALEKNPVAYRFLVENVDQNGAQRVVTPWHGDNREYPFEELADRVHMGYVGGTRRFLPKAFALLKPEGGVIHLHDTAHADSWKEELTRAVLDEARACGTVVRIADARVVKSYSPGVVHAVLEAHVRR